MFIIRPEYCGDYFWILLYFRLLWFVLCVCGPHGSSNRPLQHTPLNLHSSCRALREFVCWIIVSVVFPSARVWIKNLQQNIWFAYLKVYVQLELAGSIRLIFQFCFLALPSSSLYFYAIQLLPIFSCHFSSVFVFNIHNIAFPSYQIDFAYQSFE